MVVRFREKRVNLKKIYVDGLFFKALANRFWLTTKSCSWFSKVDHGRPSIKWTS